MDSVTQQAGFVSCSWVARVGYTHTYCPWGMSSRNFGLLPLVIASIAISSVSSEHYCSSVVDPSYWRTGHTHDRRRKVHNFPVPTFQSVSSALTAKHGKQAMVSTRGYWMTTAHCPLLLPASGLKVELYSLSSAGRICDCIKFVLLPSFANLMQLFVRVPAFFVFQYIRGDFLPSGLSGAMSFLAMSSVTW